MKLKLFYRFLFTLGLGVAVYFFAVAMTCDLKTCSIYCPPMDKFGDFYSSNLRASLFAGFLTLGGFLMSLKTFIIVNMKKEVYDSKHYQDLWTDRKKLDTKNLMPSIYTPLRDLSSVLYITILLCVASAVSQLTIGLFGNLWTSIFCVWLAALSIVSLVWCLTLIRKNLTTMFNNLDEQQKLNNEK